MEIKIVISDSKAADTGASSSVHAESGAPQSTAPPELLQAAAAIGAINAGPAPTLAAAPSEGPSPFIGTGAIGDMPGAFGSASSAPESAGAAPGSAAFVETTSAPEGTS